MALDRRQFLRWSGILALASSVPLVGCARATYPPRSLRFFTPRQWAALDAASRRLIPPQGPLPGAGELGVADAADHLLAKANPTLQADLKRLLDLFESFPSWLGGAPFSRRPASEQDALLRGWMEAPLWPVRQGFTALNKLTAMLFYMDPRSWPAIGFAGPWIGRIDLGLGPNNQGDMPSPVNPHVFEREPHV